MSDILPIYINQIQPLSIQLDWGNIITLFTTILAIMVFYFNVSSAQKKDRKEYKKETVDLIATKVDQTDFKEYKKVHSESHTALKEIVDKKASKEVVDLMHDDIKEVKEGIRQILLNFNTNK